METATQLVQTTEAQVVREKNPLIGIHAVIRNSTTGDITVVKKPTKKELVKTLADTYDHQVLAIFKGKQLLIKEKKSYSLI